MEVTRYKAFLIIKYVMVLMLIGVSFNDYYYVIHAVGTESEINEIESSDELKETSDLGNIGSTSDEVLETESTVLEETSHTELGDESSESVLESISESQEIESLESQEIDSRESQDDSDKIEEPQDETDSTGVEYTLATDKDFEFIKGSIGYTIDGVTGYYRYKGNDAYVEIPSEIHGHKIVNYYRMFSESKSTLKGVKSTNPARYMQQMFMLSQSTELDLRELDTSHVVQMYGMFTDSYMEKIDLSNFNTSKVTNFAQMFNRSRAKELDLSSFDTTSATTMNAMFYYAHAKRVDLSSFNTSNVTDMGNMFHWFHAEELDLRHFDTSKVTVMSGMFAFNKARLLDVSQFNTSNVTRMNTMFSHSETGYIDISGFDTSNVTHMNSMFYNSAATNIDVSNFNTSKVITMGQMFYNTRTPHLDVSGFDTSKVRDMGYMFYHSAATNIDVSGFDTSNVTDMSYMFRNSKTNNLDVSNFNTSKVTTMIQMFYSVKAPVIDVSGFDTSKVKNMSWMFYSTSAKVLDVSQFDTSNVTSMSQMFYNSNALELDVSGFDTRMVRNMEQMFMGTKVKELDLSSFNTERIMNMSDMFRASQIESIDVSSFDTTYVLNMSGMFRETKLTEVDLRNFDMKSANNTNHMFYNSNIKKVISRASYDTNKIKQSLGNPSQLEVIPYHQMATDEDFSGTVNGEFKYIGSDDYVEIPLYIKGVRVTSYRNMFEGTAVQGVINTTDEITDMSGMFRNNTSDRLEIVSLNTKGVLDMSSMFEGSKATYIDLRRFDTQNTTNMARMFKDSKLPVMDLGQINLSKVTQLDNIFQGVQAKTGYARTKEDLNKINKSKNKPSHLNFTVWGVTSRQSTGDWTKEHVEIILEAESDTQDIDFVEMINEPGRNLMRNANFNNHTINVAYLSSLITKEYVKVPEWGVTDAVRVVSRKGEHASLQFHWGMRNTEEWYGLEATHSMHVKNTGDVPFTVGYNGLNGAGSIHIPVGFSGRINATGKFRTSHNFIQVMIYSPEPSVEGIFWGQKIELGNTATDWTPAPEDVQSSSSQDDVFTVFFNGTYMFRATDMAGNTRTIAHVVENIDKDMPNIRVLDRPKEWTTGPVTLEVQADDPTSGISTITLPNNEVVPTDEATFDVVENGEYTFITEDLAGNKTEITEIVDNIGIYVDVNHVALKPVKGSTTGETEPVLLKTERKQGMVGQPIESSILTDESLLLDTDEQIRYGYNNQYQLKGQSIMNNSTVSTVIPNKEANELTVYYTPKAREVTVNHKEVLFNLEEDDSLKFDGVKGDILFSERRWVDVNNEKYTALEDADAKLKNQYKFTYLVGLNEGQQVNELDNTRTYSINSTNFNVNQVNLYYATPVACLPEYQQESESNLVECIETKESNDLNNLGMYYNTYLQKPEDSQFDESDTSHAIYNAVGYIMDDTDYYGVTNLGLQLHNTQDNTVNESNNTKTKVYVSSILDDFNVQNSIGVTNPTDTKGQLINLPDNVGHTNDLKIDNKELTLDMTTWSDKLAADTLIPTEQLSTDGNVLNNRLSMSQIKSIKHQYEPLFSANGFMFVGHYIGTELDETDQGLSQLTVTTQNPYAMSYKGVKDSYDTRGHIVGREVQYKTDEDARHRNYYERLSLGNLPKGEDSQSGDVTEYHTQQGINLTDVLSYTNELEGVQLPYVTETSQLKEQDKNLQFNKDSFIYAVSEVDSVSQGLESANIKETLNNEQRHLLGGTISGVGLTINYNDLEPEHVYQLNYDIYDTYSPGINALGITTDQVFAVGQDSGLQVAINDKIDSSDIQEINGVTRRYGRVLDSRLTQDNKVIGQSIQSENALNQYNDVLRGLGIDADTNQDTLMTKGDGSVYYLPIDDEVDTVYNNRMILGQVGLNDFSLIREDAFTTDTYLYGVGDQVTYSPQRGSIKSGDVINLGDKYNVLDNKTFNKLQEQLASFKQVQGSRMMYTEILDNIFNTTYNID